MSRVLRVKVTTGETDNKLFRQTLNGKGFSNDGRYQFFFEDDMEEADFWIVRNKYVKKTMHCHVSPANTILLLSEPESVVKFPRSYLNQFGMVCSCQENLKHKNVVYTHAILPWFIGQNDKGIIQREDVINYDKLKKEEFPAKTKLISVITSNKAFTKGHLERIEFVMKLKKHFGDKIDVFGRGFNDFDDKWDVLAPYKYHIAIENSSSKHYWTEKLSDCYLAGNFPFYYGCTNIEDYFPSESFKKIDINRFEETIELIENTILNNEFEKKKDKLIECKNLVLDEYNMFNEIASFCDKLKPDSPKRLVKLNPPSKSLEFGLLYDLTIKRNLFKIKHRLKSKNHDTPLG